MRWKLVFGIVIGALAVCPSVGAAAEHAGKEHGGAAEATKEHGGVTQEHAGQEHGGTTEATQSGGFKLGESVLGKDTLGGVEPSAEQLRQTIRDHIAQVEQEDGAFTIEDEITESTRTLTLVRVHDRVGKTGDFYYSCTDMQDTSTGELLDLDFDLELRDDQLDVVDVRIHKLNGQPRYTYDDQDNRIPLM